MATHTAQFRCVTTAADLAQEEAVESVLHECVGRFGRLDCVYNVAGISARGFGDGALHEIKSALILQPGPAALTDGLDQLVRIVGDWASRVSSAVR